MKLLFLASLSPRTGNMTTARRICDHIQEGGHLCTLRDIGDFKSSSEVADLISEDKFDAALIIHLYKAGRLLLDSSVPYGAIFGGTDVNEDIKDAKKHEVMGTIVQKARFLVAFTDQLKNTAELHWPLAGSKVHVQPQGVVTKPCAKFNWGEFLQNSGRTSMRMNGISTSLLQDLRGIQFTSSDPYIFLLVCGLRRVKDPLYLVDAFSAWHEREPCVYLIIIGPEVDAVFAQQVKAKVKGAHGVYLVSEKPQTELHAAMRDSFAVVNSSISEGMSATILEAMDLKVPVLARNIPGNRAIVNHEHTGLLYSHPQEFVELSKRLMSDSGLKRSIVTKAKEYVEKHHSRNSERKTYQELVSELL